jgi:hypothetical protein|tara:strand:+ start:88 stop:429 length:342 start_codon:yes stop_codon:yes gene_type:complete
MTTDTRSQYFEDGQNTGGTIATWVDIPENLPDSECAEWCGACEGEYAQTHCYMVNEVIEGELNGRQYSPFEFYAHDLNSLDEWDSSEAWNDYDEGVRDGATAEITKRLDAYFS